MSAIKIKMEQQNRDSVSELQFVEALRNYDERAFRKLIDLYQTTMVRMALRYVDDTETAKDVVQETWLAVLRGVHKFAGRASFKTWLFAILINRARTRGKQAKRLVSLSEWEWEQLSEEETQWTDRYASGPSVRPMLLATNAPEEQVLRQDVQAYLVQALLTLPLTQRKVFILHDMEGWTVDEICRMLDLTEGNQRVLLHRARAKLRRLLAEYLTDHP